MESFEGTNESDIYIFYLVYPSCTRRCTISKGRGKKERKGKIVILRGREREEGYDIIART